MDTANAFVGHANVCLASLGLPANVLCPRKLALHQMGKFAAAMANVFVENATASRMKMVLDIPVHFAIFARLVLIIFNPKKQTN